MSRSFHRKIIALGLQDFGSFFSSIIDVSWPLQETAGAVAGATNPAVALGREWVVNGGFDTDTDWTKGTGWTIAAGVASCDGTQVANTSLVQDFSHGNKTYKISYDVLNYSAGQVRFQFQLSAGAWRTADGSYTEVVTASGGDGILFTADPNFIGDIDNVSLKQTDIAASSSFSDPANNPFSGSHTGVAVGQSGFGNIPYSASYNGTTSETDLTGAEVNSTLYPDTFSVPIFVQKDTWDTTKRWLFYHFVDANNYFGVATSATLGELVYEYRSEGMGAPVTITHDTSQTTDPFSVIQTVSGGTMYAWYNGTQIGSASVAGGTFTGNYTKNFIGSGGGANYHLGKLAYNGYTINDILSDSDSALLHQRSGF
jgi:hypothetical protein